MTGSRRAQALREAERNAASFRGHARWWLKMARGCFNRRDPHRRNYEADHARDALRNAQEWAALADDLRAGREPAKRTKPLAYPPR